MLLPPTYPITLETMNWTVIVIFGFVLFGIIYWMVYAHKHFLGPGHAYGHHAADSELNRLLS